MLTGTHFPKSAVNKGVSEITVTQKVDHFDALSTDTWSQRVFINDTYFNAATGIIFFLLGGEGPMGSSSVTDHFILAKYAQQFGALIVGAEHRYYGGSNPTPTLNVEQGLRYLSTEQALEDFATVRNFVVDKYLSHARDTAKVVAFGGSYSGNLASWIRAKYPHLFVGALASSSPVLAKVDFHEYMQVVFRSVGTSCGNTMRAATNEYERMAQTEEGRKRLDSLFKTCKPLTLDANNLGTFFSSIADPVCGVVQYNNDNNKYSGSWNITKMCQTVTGGPTPVDGYANFVNQYAEFLGEDCITSTYEDYLNELKNEKTFDQGNLAAAGRSWVYQTCSEFGYYQHAEGGDQPFSTKYLTANWFLQQCKDIYGLDVATVAPAVKAINQRYGGDMPAFTDKIFFSNGDVDPWHALRVRSSAAQTSLMHGTAHCADLYPARDSDVSDLKSTREVFLSKLKQWLM
uniref:Uncharacterized protein n=1 Tax=Percolomonas cosmopolitus TaxID=63605 RepID=A0A7S1KLV8_9EUKA